MAIQRSGSWNENDLTEDEIVTPSPDSIPKKKKVVEESKNIEPEIEEEEQVEYKERPLFNKNFFLDDEMYDKFNNSKSDKSELLDVISSTSEKEDNVFIQLGCTFVICLLIVCVLEVIVNTIIGKEINSWNSMRYILAIGLTYAVTKFINNRKV